MERKNLHAGGKACQKGHEDKTGAPEGKDGAREK